MNDNIKMGVYSLILSICGKKIPGESLRAYPDVTEALDYIEGGKPFIGDYLSEQDLIQQAKEAEMLEELEEEEVNIVDSCYTQLQLFA